MKNNIVSIKLSEDKVSKFISFYSDHKIENNGDYIVLCAKVNGVTVTLYESKKGHTATFVGENSLSEAQIWDEKAEIIKIKPKQKEEWLCLDNQIGSDEVGVGDFFLPMIVVAAYVSKNDIEDLISLGIHDSKKMKDETILSLGPTLIKRFVVSKLTLSNEKYNQMILKGENLNSLKAKMHNQALKNIKNKYPNTKNVFIDEFAKESTYYSYLVNDNPLRGITFKTKGESFYPSIALASVLARYSFLLEKRKLEEQYGVEFPLGASKKVDEFAKEFISKFGEKEFEKLVKKNFANYRKALED